LSTSSVARTVVATFGTGIDNAVRRQRDCRLERRCRANFGGGRMRPVGGTEWIALAAGGRSSQTDGGEQQTKGLHGVALGRGEKRGESYLLNCHPR